MQSASTSADEGICRTISAAAQRAKDADTIDRFKQRLQQLREDAAIDDHSFKNVTRRASATCEDLKNMADACTSHIDKIVEGQKIFFRSLPEQDLDAAIEAKYTKFTKCKGGRMTRKEFACAIATMGKEFSEDELRECFEAVDVANKGVSLEKFNSWFREYIGAPQKEEKIQMPGLNDPITDPIALLRGPSCRTPFLRRTSFAAMACITPTSGARGRRNSLLANGNLTSGAQSTDSVIEKRKNQISRCSSVPEPSRVSSVDDTKSSRSSISLDNTGMVRTGNSGSSSSSGARVSSTAAGPRGRRSSLSQSPTPGVPNATRAQELLKTLEKRKNLSSTYGRLPGWRARLTTSSGSGRTFGSIQGSLPSGSSGSGGGTGLPASSSANNVGATCSVQEDAAATSALNPTGMDSADTSTQADTTKVIARHSWSTAFRNVLSKSFKMKRDSLRDVYQSKEAQQAVKLGRVPRPFAGLTEAIQSVKTLLSESVILRLASIKTTQAGKSTALPPARDSTTSESTAPPPGSAWEEDHTRASGGGSLLDDYARVKRLEQRLRVRSESLSESRPGPGPGAAAQADSDVSG